MPHNLDLETLSEDKNTPAVLKIPTEILRQIISYADVPTLLSLTLVNKHFHSVISSPHTWRLLFLAWFEDCRGQFTPLCHPSNIEVWQDALDVQSNHWRTEAILRKRLLKNLAKSRPELVTAGYVGNCKYVPSIENNFATSTQTLRPTARILEFFHSVNPPIVTLDTNWTKPPLKLHPTFSCTLDEHPAPSMRITAADGSAGLWHPGNGRQKEQHDDGTMVFTRWESNYGILGLQPHLDVSTISTNGAASYAAIGRDRDFDFVSLYYSFRLGSGEQIKQLIQTSTPGRNGIGLDVWIADLAGLGCVPGVGLKKAYMADGSERNERIAVEEASPLFTHYSLGLVMVTTQGEVHMFKASTKPQSFKKPNKIQPIETTHMAGWKLCPRIAIASLRVDDHYTEEKRLAGRPWCVVQNILGEIWTFSGDPRPREVYIPPDISEAEQWDTDLKTAQEAIEAGPISDRLSKMHKSKREALFARILHGVATKVKEEREKDLRIAEEKRNAHIQGSWTMIEDTRIERPISGFYLDDLGRELGLVLGDNDSWETPKRNCLLEVDFFSYVVVSFFVGGDDDKRTRGVLYKLNEEYERPEVLPMEDDIVGSQARRGSENEWIKTKLRVPRSSEEILDKKNFQKITAIAMDHAPICYQPITMPKENIIGSNARYLAIGTNHSKIFAYNIRGSPMQKGSDVMLPLRTCKITGGPSITCLGLHSLALIVGASNGGVVVFDLLGSQPHPVRKLVQASTPNDKKNYIEAMRDYGYSLQEIERPWADLTRATAITIDPNPDLWRGAVAVGAHVLYWDETECLRWQFADDIEGHKKLQKAAKSQAETEAEEARKRIKPQKPVLGRAALNQKTREIESGVYDPDEEDHLTHYERWQEAYGDLDEEERMILEKEMRNLGLNDYAEKILDDATANEDY